MKLRELETDSSSQLNLLHPNGSGANIVEEVSGCIPERNPARSALLLSRIWKQIP